MMIHRVIQLLILQTLLLYCQFTFTTPISSGNQPGISSSANNNGKFPEDLSCRTEDGRIQIPIYGKLRLGVNACKTCTCTVTGFVCDDRCDTNSTSVISEVNKSNMTSSESMVIGASLPLSAVLSMALNSSAPTTASSTTITTTTTTSSNSDDEINNIIPGVSCSRPAAAREYAFVDCSEVYLAGKRTSGIYEIWPRTSPKPFRVLCDMDTDGGGWTVIQRRGDFVQQSNFFVGWSSYKRGFGDLTRDFWLGNEKIHALTNQDEYRLHIDMEDFNDQSRFADYEWFFVTNEQTKYTLNLGRYLPSSTAGDSLSYNRGMRFSTRDQDNDQSMLSQCAENYRSGWWHAGCTLANLNGLYLRGNDTTATGVFWNNWLGAKYSLKVCEMKVRPTGFNTEMLS